MTSPAATTWETMVVRLLYGWILNALIARATSRLMLRVPDRDFGLAAKLERMVAALIIAAALVVGLVTIGGILGALHSLPAMFLLTVAIVSIAEWSSRGLVRRTNGQVTGLASRFEDPASLRIAGTILLLTWIPLACERLALPPVAWDALTYHLRFPQIWFHTGHLTTASTPMGDSSNIYYPLGGEALLYWGILTTGTDLWSAVSQVPFALISACALAALAIRAGARQRTALLAAACWLGTPGVLRQSVEPMLDVVLTAYVVAILLFAVRWQQAGDRAWLYLTASAVALLVGIKFAGLLFAVALFPLMFHAARRARSQGSTIRAQDWIACVVVVVSVGGYTYVRNLASGGNPVLPLRIGLGQWTLFPGNVPASYYFGSSAKRLSWGAFFLSGRSILEMGPAFLGLIALLPFTLFRSRRQQGQGDSLTPWLAGTGIFLLVLGGVALPFREHRYFFHVVAIGWICAAALLGAPLSERRQRWTWRLLALLLLIEAPLALVYWGKDLLLVGPNGSHVAAVAIVMGLAISTSSKIRTLFAPIGRTWSRHTVVRGWGLVALAAVFILFLGFVTEDYEGSRFELWQDYWSSRHTWQDRQRPRADYQDMASSWSLLADRTRQVPVTVAYSGMNVPYALSGYWLRNTVLFVPRNGNASAAWYEWGSAPLDPISHPDSTAWTRNVRKLRVRYLCVYRLSDPGTEPSFPIEARWAEEAPDRFRLILSKEHARIYEVVGDQI